MFTTIWSNRFTRLTKLVTCKKFSKPIVLFAIKKFIASYPVNVQEIKHPLDTYPTLDAFFTRSLKPDTRPINKNEKILVSPVDAVVQECGIITDGQLIQAKGVHYSVKDLCPHSQENYEEGLFATFYLAPFDCHRIFMPCNGAVTQSEHVPGILAPVREPYISGYPNLYTKNERLTSYLQTNHGTVAVVKVGALNVGSMSTTYDSTLTTNLSNKKLTTTYYKKPMYLSKGQHLATFHLGSTVIVLIPKKNNYKWGIKKGDAVKYGQAILNV